MLFSSSRWQVLLCATVLILGYLTPAVHTQGIFDKDIKTSKVYKVLTDDMGVGGSCDTRIKAAKEDSSKPNPEEAMNQILRMSQAAIEALKSAEENVNERQMKKEKYRQNRKRITYMANQVWGARVSLDTLAHNENFDSADRLKNRYEKLVAYINKKPKEWAFACDDSWAESVTELKTAFGGFKKGTAIKDIPFLNEKNLGRAWYDRTKKEDNAPNAYWSSSRWSEEGPCVKVGTSTQVEAETVFFTKVIYTCPRLWDLQFTDGVNLKADITPYGPKGKKDVDLEKFPDLGYYQSPASTIFHEMVHQILGGQDGAAGQRGLGYGWENVARGITDSANALENPDSFTYFAMAMYLSKYDWSTGKARKLDEMPGEKNAK
ncbi:Protein kinase [Penicillium waksmanii]|uniref:Protein kinase n=1 Tax=Penicillium waksmanii TaxID=69791 RepID=UPI002547389A|nr:Protein kinase [Penicillium waksmanii]KAJ5988677.1 Protein kinase [Penicillium waksmanii]